MASWTVGLDVHRARSFHGFFKGDRGLESSFWLTVVVAPLLLPLGADIRVGYQVRSILIESVSVSSSEASYIGDSTERSDSGVSPMNPTKVFLEPACRRLEVSMGTSGS